MSETTEHLGATPKNEGGGVTETARNAGTDLREGVAEEARTVRDAATEQLRSRAEGAREGLADEVSSVGEAMRKASAELRRGSAQEQLFGQMAESLAEFSDSLRGQDVPQLIGRISDFGRRNPMAFLGGAALLGFAGARAVRASERDRTDQPAPTGVAPRSLPVD